jgi:hypothetical protein
MSLSVRARFDLNSEIFEKAKQAGIAKVISKAQERVRGLRCPEHGGPVTVTLNGDSLTVSTCCQQVTQQATRLITSK